jgi:ABC-type transporter MlaC component
MLNLYKCSTTIVIDNTVIKNHVKNVILPFWTRRFANTGDTTTTEMYVSGVGDMGNYVKFHSCADKVYSITI